MANERYNVEIGLQFLPGQASAQVAGEIQRILREAESAAKSGGGILDLTTADKFGERLASAIKRAVNQDLKSSSLFQALRPKDQKILQGLQVPDAATSRFLDTQLALARANQKREEVAARAALTPGSKSTRSVNLPTTGDSYIAKPFTDVATRTGTVQAAEQAYARAVTKAAAAREKFIGEITGAERKEQEAIATQTIAIKRNTDRADAAENQRLNAIGQQIQAIKRNTAAAEKAANAEAERVRNLGEAKAAQSFPVSYPNAARNPNERLGAAQEGYNIAERRLAIANSDLAAVRLSSTATGKQELVAQNALDQATRSLTTARQRVAQEETRATDLLGRTPQGRVGVGAQFAQGFQGVGGRPFAEQIGQAFKFSVFYGTAYKILFAITQTFQQTLQEGIAFQQAVSELQLATGKTKEAAQDLANQFGEEASRYGFGPSEGAIIGARAQGFYGTTDASTDVQRQVGEVSARVVSQIAFASGRQAQDIQGNLAAVGQAYGLGSQSQQYIGDLDAYFARKFGIGAGATIGAIAQSGTVGRAAGFTPEEVGALAADIIARTGASEASAGGYLAQIFSRAGEGSLVGLTQRYGIDQTGSFAEQFRSLAQIYKARPEEQDNISAAFGRGKVQNAVISLLQDFETVDKAAKDARSQAPGELAKSADLKLGNIGGQIQALTGSLKEFAQELGDSGVLDALGAAALGFRSIVDAGTELLQIFNELPRPLRDAVLALGAFIAATRLAAATETGVAAGGGLRGAAAFGQAGLAGRAGVYRSQLPFATPGFAPGTRLVDVAGRGPVPLASARGGIAAATSAAGSYGVLAAALVDAYLINKTRDTTERFNKARESYVDALSSHEENLNLAEGQQSRAATFEAVRKESADAAEGFFANAKNRGADADKARDDADRAKANRDLAEANAKLIDNYNTSTDPTTALITGFDSEGISSSLDAIKASGGTAAEQFDALTQSVRASGEAAARAAANYDPDVVAAQNSASLYEQLLKGAPRTGTLLGKEIPLGNSGPGFSVKEQPNAAGNFLNGLVNQSTFGVSGGPIGTEDLTKEIFTQALSQGDLQKRMAKALSQIGSLGDLDPETVKALASQIVGTSAQDIINASDGQLEGSDYDAIQSSLTGAVEKYLTDLKDRAVGTGELITLTNTELTLLADQTLATAQEAINNLPETSYGDRIKQARQAVRGLLRYIRQTPGAENNPQAQLDLQQAQQLLAQEQFNHLEALRSAAQANADSQGEAQAIGRRFLRRELRSAIANNDGDQLAQILSQAGKGAIATARRMIQDAAAVALAAQEFQAKSQALMSYLATGELVKPGQQSTAEPVNPLQGLLDNLNAITPAEGAADVYTGTGVGPSETAADRAVAAAQANAARRQGQIAQARADIYGARVAMDQAKKGTVEYYNALGQYYQARQALSDAIIAYKQNLYLLGHDITNPLTQARAAVQAAAAQLRADRGSGAGADQLAADRVELQQAQADAESTAFSQRLEAVQTADDLGRISHQKYLSYLQHEHERLTAIKNRTFQQQQQLDQIDGLMKEAAEQMAGQWNFGDIKLPTPYEVQRRVQEVYGNAVNGGKAIARDPLTQDLRPNYDHGSNVTNTVFITGTDTAAVRKVLKELLGNHATTSTTAPRHR